ncbi:hypothetical protein T4D_1709 [Trichinella pseudospiralis]|uniref:Uncharacterized protein n=1 Tax=Trichinella pseudospiralis TaxID=6337 RepID=A0A0V1DQ66_TRIPS|nr:hypothetical protein T4D_1709 [Trichinella pseudospiralis]
MNFYKGIIFDVVVKYSLKQQRLLQYFIDGLSCV